MDIKIKVEIGHTLASVIMALSCQDSDKINAALEDLKKQTDIAKAAMEAATQPTGS